MKPPPFSGAAVALLLLAGCRGTLSPLSNRLKLGEEAYIVFTADGEDGKGDLFASPAAGGKSFQVTFTRVDERAPALSPDGVVLAFLRSIAPGDTSGVSVVLLNLLSGAERRVDAPPGASSLAWLPDGTVLLVRAASGILRSAAPPQPLTLEPVPASGQAPADSLLRVLLGDPAVGEAGRCASGTGVCARLANGDSLTLSTEGSYPARWGTDSVAYLERGSFVIRPLAGGATRTVRWTESIEHPRGLTYFGGAPRRGNTAGQ